MISFARISIFSLLVASVDAVALRPPFPPPGDTFDEAGRKLEVLAPAASPVEKVAFTGEVFSGHEEEIAEVMSKCGDYKYEGLLHVTDHLYALGVPSQEAQDAGCPFIMMNGLVGKADQPDFSAKEMLLWSKKEHFFYHFPTEGSHSIGHFTASEAFEAFHKADATVPGVEVYDVFKNNCGTFMINLGSELGIKVDAKTTAFVATRLFEKSGKDLIEQIRSSIYFPSLFDGERKLRGNTIEGEDLVSLLVETSAADLLA